MKLSFEYLANISVGMILDLITLTKNNSEEGVEIATQKDFDNW